MVVPGTQVQVKNELPRTGWFILFLFVHALGFKDEQRVASGPVASIAGGLLSAPETHGLFGFCHIVPRRPAFGRKLLLQSALEFIEFRLQHLAWRDANV